MLQGNFRPVELPGMHMVASLRRQPRRQPAVILTLHEPGLNLLGRAVLMFVFPQSPVRRLGLAQGMIHRRHRPAVPEVSTALADITGRSCVVKSAQLSPDLLLVIGQRIHSPSQKRLLLPKVSRCAGRVSVAQIA